MIGIYKITNQTNKKAYVGQSIDIERRKQEHLYYGSNKSAIDKAIKKYGINNFSFENLEQCSQEELDELERYWIAFYDSYVKGYNLTLGGQGTPKYKVADVLAIFNKTQNLSQTARECGCSIGTVRRIVHGEGINFHEQSDAKPVEAIDPKTLQVIKRYTSIKDAASSMNVHPNAISATINGKQKSSCGYYWRLVGDETELDCSSEPKLQKTSVCQINPINGDIIATYESASAAAEVLGKDRKNGGSQITAVCKGRRKSAWGFLWCYENEKENIERISTQTKKWKQVVEQIDMKTNEVIATHESIAAAARAVNGAASPIGRVIKGERKSAYGYKWRRVEL